MIPVPFYNSNESILFDHAGAGFIPWFVPQNARELFILAQGGGGGGGNGFSRAAGTAGGGGGGAGSGARSIVRVPTALLPPVLYIRVGAGGLAGVAGGESGAQTRPINGSGVHTVLRANGGSPGGNGSAAAAGALGVLGSAINTGQASLLQFATHFLVAGMAGVAGGAQTGAVGANITWSSGNGFLTSGGAGGAGTTSGDFAGGSIINGIDGFAPTASGGAAGSFDGAQGAFGMAPPWSQGGAGGGSSNTGNGGRGGDAGKGSGGGGGGAGVVGGQGGRGGDGFVWILPLF